MRYPQLVEHLASGPIVVYVLMKTNCIDEWKRCVGPPNVAFARTYHPLTLRAIYGLDPETSAAANGFHGSDSRLAAHKEILFFFPYSDLDDTLNLDVMMDFIQNVMMPVINKGFGELYKENPDDPLRWFANWIMHNNPNKSESDARK
ncbi:nucleoside diphosphate kinase homolog 5-like [Adelges cooleyi]|uniref:nucleoside diphosphate kinase homolog 5-like n=1 Tax=Adelges cooleyi TaxID=133065 RepID=UPI00217F2BD5|nr:nucleoside diphosphate kinase homolog 5-like [Adelges cooleyi]